MFMIHISNAQARREISSALPGNECYHITYSLLPSVTTKPPNCKYDFLNPDNKCLPLWNYFAKNIVKELSKFFTPTDEQVFKEVLKFTLKHTKSQGISNTMECTGNSM